MNIIIKKLMSDGEILPLIKYIHYMVNMILQTHILSNKS